MDTASSDNSDYQEYEDERRKTSCIATPTGDSYTSHPERELELQAGDPRLSGGAPAEAKTTMAEKVKGMFKGHHHEGDDDDSAHAPQEGNAVAGSAAVDSGIPGQGEALTNEKGDLKPGPHTDSVKRDTIVSKIKDKLHK